MSEPLNTCEWCGMGYTYAIWVVGQGASCPTCLRATRGWIPGPRVTKRLRRIAERDGWICHVCGAQVPPDVRGPIGPSLDHLIPVRIGGSNDDANLALAHAWCNSHRGDQPPPGWTLTEPWWPSTTSESSQTKPTAEAPQLPEVLQRQLVSILAREVRLHRSNRRNRNANNSQAAQTDDG